MEAILLCLLVASHAMSVGGAYRVEAPPPNMGRPYENETHLSMDEMITSAFGGIDTAAQHIMSDGSNILAELDMYLTKDQFLGMYEPPKASEMKEMGMYPAPLGAPLGDEGYIYEDNLGVRSKRKAARDVRTRWTNAKVPYLFAKGHFDTKEEYMMRRSMTEWERYTCIRFTPSDSHEKNSLRFQNGVGCNSQLGMVGTGSQILNLQKPGCRFKGLYLHEIGHALGLVHEHQLPDRDQYVDIIYGNVSPHMRIWFNKYTNKEVNQLGVPYEYSSVMHYGITAFAYDGKAQTIKAKDASKEAEIGRVYLKELAYTDVAVVNKMYGCSEHCADQNKCTKDGHLDQNCNCICRDGSADSCDRSKRKDTSCRNNYDSWSCFIWANQGECQRNEGYMSEHCAKACNMCGSHKARHVNSITWTWQWLPMFANMFPPNWMDIASCTDAFPTDKCEVWRERGDCITSKEWMKDNCGFTCKLCNDGPTDDANCENQHNEPEKCAGWALDGECKVNRKWMFDNCRSACLLCAVTATNETGDGVDEDKMECENTHELCERWAKAGECISNPNWMNNNCRQACGKCDDGSCKNLYDSVQCDIWAQKQECIKNAVWMRHHCAMACKQGKCNGDGDGDGVTSVTDTPTTKGRGQTKGRTDRPTNRRTTPKPRVTTQGTCRNKHSSPTECEIWAKFDHCNINPRWMRKNCALACGECTASGGDHTTASVTTEGTTEGGSDGGTDGGTDAGTCVDREVNCPFWARDGYCDRNPQYNLVYCKKSCNNCNSGCRDTEFLCEVWAAAGHCNKNPLYMLRKCQKSCKVCSV